MASPEKFWFKEMGLWLTEAELKKWREDLAGFANLIGSEIAKRSMTREEVQTLFSCIQQNLTLGGFRRIGENNEAPTPESSEPRTD